MPALWTDHVVVALATCKRPDKLDYLLHSMTQIDGADRLKRIIVVDNDAAGSAREVAEKYAPLVHYVVEPVPGIAPARNRGLALLEPSDQAVIFIDDDEFPAQDWFTTLVGYADQTDADVVTGPVVPAFDDDTPQWLIDGGFWQRQRRDTGSEVAYVATNNTLVRTRLLERAPDVRFDPVIGEMGGSDTHFFHQLEDHANFYLWCDEAVVKEWVLPERANLKWLFRRGVRIGNIHARSTPSALKNLVKAGMRIGGGSILSLKDLVVHQHFTAKNFLMVAHGVGRLGQAVGKPVVEYRRPAGESAPSPSPETADSAHRQEASAS